MHITRWITKAPDTHTEYEIFLGFPRQLITRTLLIVIFIRTLPVLYLHPNGFIGLAVRYEPNQSNPPRS